METDTWIGGKNRQGVVIFAFHRQAKGKDGLSSLGPQYDLLPSVNTPGRLIGPEALQSHVLSWERAFRWWRLALSCRAGVGRARGHEAPLRSGVDHGGFDASVWQWEASLPFKREIARQHSQTLLTLTSNSGLFLACQFVEL